MPKNECEFEGPERGENQATKKEVVDLQQALRNNSSPPTNRELGDLKEQLEKALAATKKRREQKTTEYFVDKDGCKIYYKDLELARKLCEEELLEKKEKEKGRGK